MGKALTNSPTNQTPTNKVVYFWLTPTEKWASHPVSRQHGVHSPLWCLNDLLLAYGNWEVEWWAVGGWRWLTGKIKAQALVVLPAGVNCLQLWEECEGKMMFKSRSVLPVTAPRGTSVSKTIRLTSSTSVRWPCVDQSARRKKNQTDHKHRCAAVRPERGADNRSDLQKQDRATHWGLL